MKEAILKTADENQNETSCALYVYNEKLADKEILLHDRVLEWFKGDGRDCLAIQNQYYLEIGNIRNDTLEAVMRRDHLSQDEAIEKIIFQHKLPLSLIQVVLAYGIIVNDEDENITIEAPVQVCVDKNPPAYFLAEITGKIRNNNIKIWHVFLRDIAIKKYMFHLFENRLSSSYLSQEPVQTCPSLEVESLINQIILEERISHKSEDNLEGFSSVIESKTCEIRSSTAYITIKKENILFTVFKQ